MTRKNAWLLTLIRTRIKFSRFLHRTLHLTNKDLAEQNCMGYAFNQQDWLDLGSFYHSDSTERMLEVFEECCQELCDDFSCRPVPSPASANKNERIIAFRIGPTDFHFARLDRGKWTHKPGMFPIKSMSKSELTSDSWVNLSGTVYNSPVRYFALRK